MLQTVLAVAIPTVLTLVAAIFVARKASQTEQSHNQRRSNFTNLGANRSHPNDRARRRPKTKNSQNTDNEDECLICFYQKEMVELNPCGHKNVCMDCIIKHLNARKPSQRLCPFCREPIRGFSS